MSVFGSVYNLNTLYTPNMRIKLNLSHRIAETT